MKRFGWIVGLGLLVALPLSGELVVFTDGGYLKVAAFEAHGNRLHVELVGGGSMTVPLERVDRVVDDEVVILPEEPEPAPPAEPDWTFSQDAPVPATPYGEEIYAAAQRHELDPELVAAVVRAESAFDARAVSHKGARGLMQLMPATGRRFGLRPDQLFEPSRNLEAGSRYLGWLLERFSGDLRLALAAYNAGEGTVDRYGGVPPYRETRNYIRRIYRFLGLSSEG
ncbi:MAG: lytic transglycosylase domain-containing protein [Acidobacteriota bacterium]